MNRIIAVLTASILLSGCDTGEPETSSGAGFVRESSILVENDTDGSVQKALTAIREDWLTAIEKHVRIIRVQDTIKSRLASNPRGQYIGNGVIVVRKAPQWQLINTIVHEAAHAASASLNPVYGQDAKAALSGKVRWFDTAEERNARNCAALYRGRNAGNCWIMR